MKVFKEYMSLFLKHNSFCQGVPEEGTYCKAPWLEWQLPGVNGETAQALIEARHHVGGRCGREAPSLPWL